VNAALSRLVTLLPQTLAQRLPLLVIVAYLAGAVISGWSVYVLYKRSSALNEAETSGESLGEIIRSASGQPGQVPGTGSNGPYVFKRLAGLPEALSEHTIPLILELGDERFRTAISFAQPPRLPQALRSEAVSASPSARLSELSKAIARQDQDAQLVIFLRENDVLFVRAPRLWQDRLSQTTVALSGAIVFALGLSACLLLAVNLAAPFQHLANRRGSSRRPGRFASTEALLVGDKIDHLAEQFHIEQDKKSRGLAAISHDLRTPVTRLRLRTELLKDAEVRTRFEADLDEVTGIIDGALDLLSIGAQAEERFRFSLAGLLESLVSDYQDVGKKVELVAPGEIELRSASSIFTASADVMVRSDNQCLMTGQPDKLRRAFSNLIDNALKYGGRAVVEVVPFTNDALKVNVRDFGPGIGPDQLDRVLLPFVRGHGSPAGRGVGLGLSIASEILALHGGHLEFTNMETGLLVTAHIARESGPID
tara:strand:+ start:5326 stop:6768 length:1443 start_codon:yes stop_codon:yes gene_type:complete